MHMCRSSLLKRLNVLSLFILALTGCAGVSEDLRGGRALVPAEHVEGSEVRLRLRALEVMGGEETRVGIVLENPRGYPVTSVRSWIQFDPALISLADLALLEPRLTLFPPGEREIDAEGGLVRFGAASTEPMRDAEILLASLVVTSIREGERGSLSFYDWREDGEGHTGAYAVLEGGIVRSLLEAPVSLTLP